jgi:acetyl-CoA carboxylase carboxyltransferase component
MYEEQGGCPAGGSVGGLAYVSGRQCVVMANDQTVKAGAWFPISGKKIWLQEIPWKITFLSFISLIVLACSFPAG